MPVADFLENFVPKAPSNTPKTRFTRIPRADSIEKKMQVAFAKNVNGKHMCPGYCIVEMEHRYDEYDSTSQTADVALYSASECPTDNRPNWNVQRLHFEFKRQYNQDDPFDDSSDDFEDVPSDRLDKRGECIQNAATLFERQQRCFCFTVMILGRWARLCRWDRSGAVISEKFDYIKERYLVEFLWRFAHLSPVQQGDDPTAIPIPKNSGDANLMREKAKPRDENCGHIREYFRNSLDESWTWWRLKIDVHVGGADSTAHEVKGEYLVGRPRFYTINMAGRGTRGYVAVDCETGNFVWLKDAWRMDHAGIEKEGDILQRLNELEIGNIPTMLQHGDILQQHTLTQDHWHVPTSNPMKTNVLKLHTHYRLVEKEVCRPMRDFKHGQELTRLVWDSHRDVMKLAGIIHRDISSGNLLINEYEIEASNGGKRIARDGILADWELSKALPDGSEESDGPRQPYRAGTWQFLSVRTLNNPFRTITVEDELESFFHVLLYFGVRYLRHNILDVDVFISKYFDDGYPIGDDWVCGDRKWAAINSGIIKDCERKLKFEFSENKHDSRRHPLTGIIVELLKSFKSYYAVGDSDTHSADVPLSDDEAGQESDDSAFTGTRALEVNVDLSSMRTNRQKEMQLKAEFDREQAKLLRSHEPTLAILVLVLKNEIWPVDDKIGDQLHPDFQTMKAQKEKGHLKRPVDAEQSAAGPSGSKRSRIQ
ncbi:hypothetical protein BKA93DRAFT_828209 [Sparassis latifolia]